MAADYMPDLLVSGLLVAAGVILVCVLVVAMATLMSCRSRPEPGAAQFRLNNVHYGAGSRASSTSRDKRRSRVSVQDEGGGE